MFFLLAFEAYSDISLLQKRGWKDEASFDVAFQGVKAGENVNNQGISSQGFFAAFRYYTDDTNSNTSFLQHNTGNVVTESNKFRAALVQNPVFNGTDHWLPVSYTITNLDTTAPLTYDLGIFGDIRFFKDDNATIKWAIENNAILVESPQASGCVAAILLKGTMFPDVDTIYMDDKSTDKEWEYKNYKYYWLNTTKETTSSQDSVIGFSWQKRVLAPGATEKLGFLVSSKKDFKRRPIISDANTKKKNLKEREYVKFNAKFYDGGEEYLNVYCQLDGQPRAKVNNILIDPSKGNIGGDVTIGPIQFGDKLSIRYTVWAITNENSIRSYETITGTFFKEGYEVPTIEVTTQPNGEYFPGDKIHVNGTVDDEQEVTIWFKFNEGEEKQIDSVPTAADGRQPFDVEIPIDSQLQPSETPITLKIWAKDNLNQPSAEKSFSFILKQPRNPVIIDAFVSDEKVIAGQKIVIYGQGTDPDHNQLINVSAGWDGLSTLQYVSSFTLPENTNTAPFYGFFYIPETAKPGYHRIHIIATDATSKHSQTYIVGITVVENEIPQPQQISKIIDITKSSGSTSPDACFNLRYIKKDGTPVAITKDEQGFFAAFRVRDRQTFKYSDPQFIRKETQEATYGNFTVKYYNDTDPISGYFQAKFDITNNNYWDTFLDLSIFADSNFGSTDQRIEARDDGRGFVVSSPENEIFYTVLTTFRDFKPAVYNINASYKIPGDTSTASMPLFESSKIPLYLGEDPMYSVWWTGKKIKAGQKVTYALTFAGHHNLRTPSTVTLDVTPLRPSKNDMVNITIKVSDDNIREQINYELNMNGTKESGNFIVNNTEFVIRKINVNVGNGPFYDINFTTHDNVINFPSGVSKRIILEWPTIEWDEITKHDYIPGDQITISGTTKNNAVFNLAYQFSSDSREVSLGQVSGNFSKVITVPDILPIPRTYTFSAWGIDQYGIPTNSKSMDMTVYVPDPPMLTKAGFSLKFARPNEKILSYIVIQDSQTQRLLDVYVKFGKDAEFKKVHSFINKVDSAQPIAFYYSVPSDATAGTYDVSVMVKDFTDLPSAPITRTLMVIG